MNKSSAKRNPYSPLPSLRTVIFQYTTDELSVCVLAALVANGAGSLACRLTGSLALAASALFQSILKSLCIQGFDMLHCFCLLIPFFVHFVNYSIGILILKALFFDHLFSFSHTFFTISWYNNTTLI